MKMLKNLKKSTPPGQMITWLKFGPLKGPSINYVYFGGGATIIDFGLRFFRGRVSLPQEENNYGVKVNFGEK